MVNLLSLCVTDAGVWHAVRNKNNASAILRSNLQSYVLSLTILRSNLQSYVVSYNVHVRTPPRSQSFSYAGLVPDRKP